MFTGGLRQVPWNLGSTIRGHSGGAVSQKQNSRPQHNSQPKSCFQLGWAILFRRESLSVLGWKWLSEGWRGGCRRNVCMGVTLNLGPHLSLNLSLRVSSGSCRVPFWFLSQVVVITLSFPSSSPVTLRQAALQDKNKKRISISLELQLVSYTCIRSQAPKCAEGP